MNRFDVFRALTEAVNHFECPDAHREAAEIIEKHPPEAVVRAFAQWLATSRLTLVGEIERRLSESPNPSAPAGPGVPRQSFTVTSDSALDVMRRQMTGLSDPGENAGPPTRDGSYRVRYNHREFDAAMIAAAGSGDAVVMTMRTFGARPQPLQVSLKHIQPSQRQRARAEAESLSGGAELEFDPFAATPDLWEAAHESE